MNVPKTRLLVLAVAALSGCQTEPNAEVGARTEALAATGQIVATQAAGNVAGSFAVGADGSASYSIPIAVPAGRAGIQPELSFNYSSRAADGIMGVGWSLAGLSSAITRCGRTLGRDGEIRGVEFGAKDYFCLDGNRLVMVAGASYAAAGAEYRTEHDTFAKIVAVGADAAGPLSFKVWSKDGRILTYGAVPEARLEGSRNIVLTDTGATTPALARYAWMLTRVEDRPGNFMTISYGNRRLWTVGAPLETWVTRIDYTGFGTTPGNRSVVFGYDAARSDRATSWIGGIQFTTTNKLDTVSTYGPAVSGGPQVLLRQYRLWYDVSALSGRTRLTRVQMCDGAAPQVCLAPTQLTYSEATTAFTRTDLPGSAWNKFFATDLNGDGHDDLLFTDANDNLFYQVSLGNDFTAPQGSNIVAADPQPYDLDADGKVDVFDDQPQADGTYLPTLYNYRGLALYHDPSTSLDPPVPGSTYGGGRIVDLDGDLLGDYLYKRGKGTWSVLPRVGGATVWGSPRSWGVGSPELFIDIDGDGLTDVLFPYQATASAPVVYRARELGDVDRKTSLVKDVCNLFIDANGDGLPDLANFDGGFTLRLNRGGGEFAPAQNAIDPTSPWLGWKGMPCQQYQELIGMQVVDYNRDGKQDLLMHGGAGAEALVWISNGSTFSPRGTGLFLSPAHPNHDANVDGRDTHLLDVNADGLFDIVHLDRLNGNTMSLYTQQPGNGDLLIHVMEPMGAERHVEYAPLPSPAMSSTCTDVTYPKRCYTGPMLVVTKEWIDNRNGGAPTSGTSAGLALAAVHSYWNAHLDSRGDGWLGFSSTTVTDPRTGATTVTKYDQSIVHLAGADRYPWKGMPTETLSYVQSYGIWHATRQRTTYGWQETNGAKTWFSYPSAADAREYEGTSFDLNQTDALFNGPSATGMVLSLSTSSTVMDAFGNPTVTQEQKGSSASTHYLTTVTQTFLNDTVNWIIGRRTATSARSDAPSGTATRSTGNTYDANGMLAQTVREPADTGSLYLRSDISRNGFGLPTTVASCGRDGVCRSETIGYDSDLIHATSKTNGLGTSSLTWHAGLDATLSETDVNGLTVAYDRDGFGRMRKVARPDGSWTATDYYSVGCGSYTFCERTTNSEGQLLGITRDRLGREDWRNSYSLDGTSTAVETSYDAVGNVHTQYRPSFWDGSPLYYSEYIDYDALNRPLWIHQNDLNRYKQLYYYQNSVYATDESGVQTVQQRDNTGHLIATGTPGLGATLYSYGPFDTLATVTDPSGNVVSMSYDTLGRRTKLVDRDIGNVTTTYNAFGEVVTTTDAKGQTTTISYDAMGRPKSRSATDGVDTWTYDPPNARGQLASRARGTVSTTWTYDALARPKRESWIIDGLTYNYDTTYDSLGRPSSIAYPDAPGRPRFTVDRVYNQYGFLTQLRDISVPATPRVLWTAQKMDAEGHLTQELLGNGLTTTRSYYGDTGLLQRETTGNVFDMEYAYQANGDLASRIDHRNSPTAAAVAHNETFTYDAANRLASATVTGRATATYAYSYDAIGNLTGATDSPCSGYTYGEGAAGPHALTGVTCAGTRIANAYDADGNETVANRPGLLQTAWTSFNKPSTMQSSSGQMQYTYDAEHARVKKAKLSGGAGPSGVWSTSIFPGRLYEKRTGSSTDHVYYVTAGGRTIAQMIWRQSPGTEDWRYLHGDRQGTVERTTDAAGTLKEATSSDAWGARRPADWTVTGAPAIPADTRVGYTGHEYDDEFGVVDMGGRIYDPAFKRFTSADSIVQAPFDGASWNRYSYVFNNPLRYTDPTGHAAMDPLGLSTALFFAGLSMAQLSGIIGQQFTPLALTSDGRLAGAQYPGGTGFFARIVNAIEGAATFSNESNERFFAALVSPAGLAGSIYVEGIGLLVLDTGDVVADDGTIIDDFAGLWKEHLLSEDAEKEKREAMYITLDQENLELAIVDSNLGYLKPYIDIAPDSFSESVGVDVAAVEGVSFHAFNLGYTVDGGYTLQGPTFNFITGVGLSGGLSMSTGWDLHQTGEAFGGSSTYSGSRYPFGVSYGFENGNLTSSGFSLGWGMESVWSTSDPVEIFGE